MTCTEIDCNGPVRARNLCGRHYEQARSSGTIAIRKTVPRGGTPEDRLRFYGWTVTDAGCWEYDGTRNLDDYGQWNQGGTSVKAHRLAYETWVGPIPEGHVVRHKCDNPPCINPDHLETGTKRDNARDMVERGRDKPHLGEANGKSKLTDQQVFEVRSRHGGGESIKGLANAYGVSYANVWDIVKGRTRLGAQDNRNSLAV